MTALQYHLYEDLSIGMVEQFDVEITSERMELFRTLSGDINPLHCDANYAVAHGYEGRVVYGMLTASFLSTLAGVYIPGELCILHSVEVKFTKPVYIGDRLIVKGEITQKHDAFQIVHIKAAIENQHKKKVARGTIQAGVRPFKAE